MSIPATAVALRLPSGWIEFDPRVPDLRAELMRAIRDEWGAVPPPEAEGHLDRLLRPLIFGVKQAVASADIILVGLFVRVLSVEGSELPLVLTANAVLGLSPAGIGLDQARADVPPGWTVAPLDLPAGPAVVATGDTQVSNDEGEAPIPARVRRYFLPVPGTARLASLSMLTPNLDFADAFVDVFDAVAETITFS